MVAESVFVHLMIHNIFLKIQIEISPNFQNKILILNQDYFSVMQGNDGIWMLQKQSKQKVSFSSEQNLGKQASKKSGAFEKVAD